MKYYITDRTQGWYVPEAIAAGFDYIQIREKDLPARELLHLTKEAVRTAVGTSTRILVNDRADVALSAGAAGVHLRAGSIAPRLIKQHWPFLTVAVSCHTLAEAHIAEQEDADFLVYGPVFDTPGKGPAVGVQRLREVCSSIRTPVIALGGINLENAPVCLNAGAAGIAGIRLTGLLLIRSPY